MRAQKLYQKYACGKHWEKHPHLELDWNFFEKVRTIRNHSIYYGNPASYHHWKEIELQIMLYINTLKKTIDEKLK